MNKIIFIIAVIITVLIPQTEAFGEDVYVTGDVVNVRSGGGKNHNVISQVASGQRLGRLGEEAGWTKVLLPGGGEGWIYSRLLSSLPPKGTLADNSRRARWYMEAGNEFFYKGRYTEATEHYKKALNLSKNDADAHYNMANSYERAGLIELAIEELLKAIGIKPNHLPARNNLALIYFEQGKYRKAVEEWNKGFEYDPRYIEANYNLARAYEKLEVDRAVKQWAFYLELAEDRPEEARIVSRVREHLKRLTAD